MIGDVLILLEPIRLASIRWHRSACNRLAGETFSVGAHRRLIPAETATAKPTAA
jgi:hypothetical protein